MSDYFDLGTCAREITTSSAGIIGQQLKIAAAHADVPISSSCYCKLS
jgi:hypothetical protein